MRKFFYWIFAALILTTACKKDPISSVTNNNKDVPSTMDELIVPPSFDWSTSITEVLTVNLSHDPQIEVNGQILFLTDNQNNILSKSIIKNDQAIFPIKLPADVDGLYLFYPNTANKQKIQFSGGSKGDVNMPIQPQPRIATKSNGLNYDHRFADELIQNYISKLPKNDKGVNLVQNPYFDQNNLAHDGRNWTKLRTPGKWYYTNSNSTAVTTNLSGNSVFKNTKSSYDVIEQSFPVSGGSTFNFSMIYSGTLNLWLDNFNSNGKWIGETHVVTSGNNISSSGNILPNATHFQFYIGLYSGAWVDSVIYISNDVIADTDGDGINDNGDDYPLDSNKAFDVYYPTIGYQTISFEDLWPSKGDYDFNDIVISSKSHFVADAGGDYVEASFEISLDACGSSLASGLGIHFLDINGNAITSSIIDSVIGYGIKDPNVTNGVIVYSNHFSAMSHYYTNTSTAYTGTPEIFNLTVKLKNTAKTSQPSTYVADLYYFDSTQRGREIHLPNKPPTSAASTTFFGTYSDDINNHYRTVNGLPWAMEIVTANKTYKHPMEKIPITSAYSQFTSWASSMGSNNSTWYNSPNSNKVYTGN